MKARASTGAPGSRRHPMRPALAALVAATVSGSSLAACSSDEPVPVVSSSTTSPDEATVSPSETSEPTVLSTETPDDASTADAPAFPADTSPDTADPSQDAMLTVTDVRIGRHDGFDRVVYEMGGTGTPGWTVQYVDEAIQDGSGTVIDLAGDGTLKVLISGSAYPMDSGAEPFESSGPVTGAGTVTVTEARGWSVFEGLTDAFIGLESPGHPFRVYLLESPVRVVVDVADETSS
ncbi:AMIN-like domain-containing (lipo)protein [Sanguibacter antarcticus]|uniref:AMIN-like domain-containing protein n=1 Tax=Sanguibacter antarcticus TaxID=372484 RepID=A0A2A9E182_9MICO|nr:hypothetical protein [Sanguibacter antarcticus]PFG32708.1 hypothetical protein ATL42_0554 [Sanguibacter antarcticus]